MASKGSNFARQKAAEVKTGNSVEGLQPLQIPEITWPICICILLLWGSGQLGVGRSRWALFRFVSVHALASVLETVF